MQKQSEVGGGRVCAYLLEDVIHVLEELILSVSQPEHG